MVGMPSSAAPLRAPLALLVVPLVVLLAGCGGADPVPSGDRPLVVQPDNPGVASSVADPTAPRIVSVVLDGDTLTGDTGVVEVRQNVPLRLVVISDRTDTVLVEGYDLRALATAEVPVQLEFLAARTGDFRVVLEGSGRELTRLRVR